MARSAESPSQQADGSPKVSVVLTCYNLGAYLEEAVDSVLGQTFQDFEIVIVDDGSTDPQTIKLLANYERPKTRVVHIENRGLPGARNEGIRQTSAPYVCAFDADDLLERTYLEKAVAVLDREPDVAFVSHWLRTFGEEDGVWSPERADLASLLDRNTINGAALVRRDALLAVGLFDETMRRGCEDWDLWISIVERGFRGVILPEVLFFYRRRSDSMSRVMMRGDTHVHLYRHLIEKHRPSFDTHLVDLLLRREKDCVTLLREVHDLELDCETTLRPEIERLRQELRASQLQIDRRQQTPTGRAERRAIGAVATRRVGREAELQRVIDALTHEVRALRGSLSWRLSRPLRAVYSWLFER